MRLHIGLLAIAVVSAALVSDEAEASPIIYFDRAQFEADVQPDLLVTFNTFQPDVCYPPAQVNGVSFCQGVADGVLRFYTTQPANTALVILPALLNFGLPDTEVRSLTLADPNLQIRAIGFDVVPRDATDITFNSPEGRDTFFFPGNTRVFVGFLFATPFSEGFYFVDSPISIGIDNVVIKTESVPEPATALLLLAGATVLAQRRRFARTK